MNMYVFVFVYICVCFLVYQSNAEKIFYVVVCLFCYLLSGYCMGRTNLKLLFVSFRC
eukprot:UN03705